MTTLKIIKTYIFCYYNASIHSTLARVILFKDLSCETNMVLPNVIMTTVNRKGIERICTNYGTHIILLLPVIRTTTFLLYSFAPAKHCTDLEDLFSHTHENFFPSPWFLQRRLTAGTAHHNSCQRIRAAIYGVIPQYISHIMTSSTGSQSHPIRPAVFPVTFNPLNAELNPICYLLALLDHHFLRVSRIRVKSLTLRLLMSYIYGAPILDVSRSHTTTHHSR